MTDSCRRGHPWNERNVLWVTSPNGRKYRQCKPCKARRLKLKYRNDEQWREKEKARCLSFYYAKQEEQHP